MTQQASFKRRIRERMAKTGERYAAARRSLLAQVPKDRRRTWASEPEASDEAVRKATGKSWDDWCDLIDAWPERSTDHTDIATYLRDTVGLDGWWSQQVTGGYERITGLRLPYERPDGTFTAGKTKTVAVDAVSLREMLLDDVQRDHLFPGQTHELRSRPDVKALRVAIGPGVAQFGLTPKADGRTSVSVQHAKLPTYDLVQEWKFYWEEWLDAIDGS